MSNAGVPLIARVYLTLGSWKRALSPALDDDSIQGINNVRFCTCYALTFLFEITVFFFFLEILISYNNATLSAKDWGKAWHIWALFNTEVMSRYTLRGRPDIAGKYVVAAVTGYFYSIACASTTKGVDDSLQVNLLFSDFYYAKLMLKYVELVDVAYILLFS
jgi:FKBP12-rapamycin complex-associated protein